MSNNILRREPAVITGVIEALAAVLLAFGLIDITRELLGLIMAVVSALLGLYTAYVTHDTILGATLALFNAALSLAVGLGLGLSTEQTGALIALAAVLVGFFQRTQTSPMANGSWRTGIEPGDAPPSPVQVVGAAHEAR
jgi:hypothetical protein